MAGDSNFKAVGPSDAAQLSEFTWDSWFLHTQDGFNVPTIWDRFHGFYSVENNILRRQHMIFKPFTGEKERKVSVH